MGNAQSCPWACTLQPHSVPPHAAGRGVTRCPLSRPVPAAASTVAFCSQCQVGGAPRQQSPHVPTRWRAWPVALEAPLPQADAFARLSSGTGSHQVSSALVSGRMTVTGHMWPVFLRSFLIEILKVMLDSVNGKLGVFGTTWVCKANYL